MTPRLRFAMCLLLTTVYPARLLAQSRGELERAPDDFGRAYWSAQCEEIAVELGALYALWFEAWA